MDLMLNGGTAMAFCAAGLFFLRFFSTTRDRLFQLFAIAFFILGLSRVPQALTRVYSEGDSPVFYLVRLAAYIVILAAIVNKNYSDRPGGAR